MLHIIRKLRLEKGLRQVDLEKLTNIPQIRISRIERGLYKSTEDERKRFLKAFDLTEDG